jgi:hypothetical protein
LMVDKITTVPKAKVGVRIGAGYLDTSTMAKEGLGACSLYLSDLRTEIIWPDNIRFDKTIQTV